MLALLSCGTTVDDQDCSREEILVRQIGDGSSLLEQVPQRVADMGHVHRVIGLFPERFAGRVPDDDAVRLEPQLLDGREPLRGHAVDVLPADGAGKLFTEPAHGGLQLGADVSAGQVVVRDGELLGSGLPSASGGEQDSHQAESHKPHRHVMSRGLDHRASFPPDASV